MNIIGFKEAKCKNCYKCVRICELKAISVKEEQAQIMNDQCILCGHCLKACPQNAKTVISDIDMVKKYIKEGKRVILSIAPAYLGVFEYDDPGQVVSALLQLGFAEVRETAEGAAYVTNEYEKLLNDSTMDNIITTSCPSVNDLVEIYYPELIPFLAPVVSPMIAHGKMIKHSIEEEAKIVFLGPCIAKKREALNDIRTRGYIDAVIFFSEVEKWLEEENIVIKQCTPMLPNNKDPMINRLYPISSGVISSVIASSNDNNSYKKFYVHGIKSCIELFDSMKKGEIHGCFIEANICEGGCIKGSAIDSKALSTYKIKLEMQERIKKLPVKKSNLVKFQDKEFFEKIFKSRAPIEVEPSEEEIKKILKKIGKMNKEDELNCSACGYATCRDKAIAVFKGKAEITMCMPYMHEKARSLANVVLSTIPNMIIVVDSELKICEFNEAAERVFHKKRKEALSLYLYDLIDPIDFIEVLESQKNIMNKKVSYEQYKTTTLQSIVYLNDQNGVMGVFKDITKEEEKNKQAYKVKVETIEMAQKVIDKQMMVAQQIAGLLGETTAETKVTLTKLRDTILFDGEEKV
ncbi:[Fe-Fe] hydrogenase large subunit C-terminal domain-containing protein [Anaeromicropila herbilytica]|uniref:Hydrogenase n=1 Tax=Anaeromicropila herbilytica TaxID=2785025 RepID=A0A7R7IDS8_9FIRM|nr:[Fe-Fe] hydrogenase large subunit C-terminal domain-containing protein [Anaeromicropila herbilytica]BCN31399.1 hydrogenase [Anaeromicropila herbilytica]